jgi:hypothetical protein
MIKSPKRKSGIFAPKVAIRPHRPEYLRWLIIGLLTALALALSWGMYDAGHQFAGFDKNEINHELDRLSRLYNRLEKEHSELRM